MGAFDDHNPSEHDVWLAPFTLIFYCIFVPYSGKPSADAASGGLTRCAYQPFSVKAPVRTHMPTPPGIAVGAVVAALIAGLVSLLGLIVSKEQKTSEFRQAWIDGLRSELSAVIAHANAIHGAGAASLESPSELWKVVRPESGIAALLSLV